MSELVNFIFVSIILLVLLAIFLNLFCKKFKLSNDKIKLYGLFLNMDTKSLIAMSSLTINFTFLAWWTVSFSGLNIIYIAISLILMLISDIVLDNPKGSILSVIFTIINCILIQVIYLIYNYIKVQNSSYILMLILVFLIIFSFLYYAYHLFRSLNNIVIKNKHIKKKDKYKV
jgi:hypothetical protein